MEQAMKTFEFTVVASGLDPQADDFEDRFFAAGCDDATISFQKGAIILEFARDARTFADAVRSALLNVVRAGAKPVHIEPDYLVSLSDIAERAGLSKAAISLYAKGERGRDFPAPVARVTTESPLWDWVEVADWMHRHDKLPAQTLAEAKVVRAANLAVQSAAEADQHTISAEKLRKEIARRKDLLEADVRD
jgi:transcriptional regulator with XRE-family HTH domain